MLSPEPDRSATDRQPVEISASSLRKGLGLFVQIAGLLATAWIVWITTVAPKLHRYSWISLVQTAFGYAVFAWLWSLAITFGLYLAIPRSERRDVLAGTLRTSATAVWFAPAIILLTNMSPAALAAALVLVVSATRLLYSQWRLLYPAEEPDILYTPMDHLFNEAEPSPFLIRQLMPAMGVALCLQMGLTAILMHVPMLAGALLAMGASMLTVFAISSGASDADRPRDLPRSVMGVLLTVLLAAGMTVGGMSGRVTGRGLAGANSDTGHKPDPVEATRALLRELFYGQQPPEEKAQEVPPSKYDKDHVPLPPEAAPAADGSYPGVILLPEVQAVTRLVAPVPANRGLSGAAARPYSIVFGGEYWMYRWMYRRPPPNSFFRKGTPAALSFSTTDHWPLMMEAHQKLDQPIDLACCAKVQLEIWNADRYPGTVAIELYAVATNSPGTPSTSLGSAPVLSTPDLKNEPVKAVPETLQFTIPPGEALDDCNEFKVVFKRDRSRADKSARVAIDRFVLVPK